MVMFAHQRSLHPDTNSESGMTEGTRVLVLIHVYKRRKIKKQGGTEILSIAVYQRRRHSGMEDVYLECAIYINLDIRYYSSVTIKLVQNGLLDRTA